MRAGQGRAKRADKGYDPCDVAGTLSRIAEALHPWVRVMELRFDALDVASYVPRGRGIRVPLAMKVATRSSVEALFESWPDSREEYERHHEVYYDYGFETWLIFHHIETGEPAHFQVLITHDDIPKVKRVLPWKLYDQIVDPHCAQRGWVYTFEKFRRMGVSLAATDLLVEYCRGRGIGRVFGHRGFVNAASLRMADRTGFVPFARVHQIQLGRQRGHQGFYFRRPL